MKNLSGDIADAVDSMVNLLEHDVDLNDVSLGDLKNVMLSKTDTFKYTKKMLDKWQNSPNAPTDENLREYLERVVNAGDNSIRILRKGLRKKQDFDKSNTRNMTTFAETKTVILESIWELDASLVELRLQLENERELNLSEKEFAIGYAEKFSNGEFFPLDDYHKDWHNQKDDAIMICPHGTKGEIRDIDGLKIQLPKKPRKSKILFSNLPKKEQYWRRDELPKGLNPTNHEAFIGYIMEEFRRRREGIWFMNNGDAVYLTGDAYFALQWGKMADTGGYMNFRYAQLEMFYFKKACLVDKRCVGELFVKSRRTGYTYVTLMCMLNEATSTCNNNYGLTSQSNEDARKAWLKLTYMFLNLPFFFRPVVKGTLDSPKKYEFGQPSDRSKRFKKKRDTNNDGYLNNLFDYQPTKDGSYDGQALRQYLGDECISPNTLILMSDMSFKKAKDIIVGDFVINGGGKVIKVAEVHSGVAEMYKVIQPYGKNYIVSANHNLLFEKGNSKEKTKDVIMKPEEYLSMTDYHKRITRRKVFKGVGFDKKDLPIDPYILGVWLGDGCSKATQFTINHKKDIEILNALKGYCDKEGFDFNCIEESDNYQKWYMKDERAKIANHLTGTVHRFKKPLKDLGIWGDKRIPVDYLKSSKKQRLELLAGIIDTDGHKRGGLKMHLR